MKLDVDSAHALKTGMRLVVEWGWEKANAINRHANYYSHVDNRDYYEVLEETKQEDWGNARTNSDPENCPHVAANPDRKKRHKKEYLNSIFYKLDSLRIMDQDNHDIYTEALNLLKGVWDA